MRIGVVGINYRVANLALREQLARVCQDLFSKENSLAALIHGVVLSTCHRLEIYFSAENLAEAHVQILASLRNAVEEDFEQKLYTYFGIDCFTHLAAVTSGLDSVIVGESEIQKQVKNAYELAAGYYLLSKDMHYLFQKSLKIGKLIRSSGMLSLQQNTLPYTLWQMSQCVFENLQERRILFLGFSEINRRLMTYFQQKKVESITLCTRQTDQKIERVQVVNWAQLSHWTQYDVIICGTYHSEYLLSASEIEQATCTCSTKLIFDLSVPRTVDPELSQYPCVTLFNMEALEHLMERRSAEQHRQLERSQEMVFQAVHRYTILFHQKQAAFAQFNA